MKAWLQTSHGRQHTLMRIRIAMHWFHACLFWGFARCFYPRQELDPLDPRCYEGFLEGFTWKAVAPTPEAERQILEYAADVVRDYVECEDIGPERLVEILRSDWITPTPIAWENRYLLVPELLGEYGAEIRYGHPD